MKTIFLLFFITINSFAYTEYDGSLAFNSENNFTYNYPFILKKEIYF